ncbi:LysE family translocator [Anaerophaga thermohalophila]|uniref:LysE family translocator n=1 Tax=Anaerophaga thermohalophila TaxID=177400 RepID=UPI0002EC42BF|nr:LysE family transporter [Anaerophaga thermohalophila]
MYWKTLFDGIMVGFSASVPLGPIGVLIIQRTLQNGRLSGFFSGLGAVMSDVIYAIIAGFSLSYIVSFIEAQMLWIQLGGVIVLTTLGIKIYRTNPAAGLRRQKAGKHTFIKDFVSTFFLTLSNPLAIFLFIAFFASFRVLKPAYGLAGHMIIISGVFLGASLWWLVLTSLVGLFRSKINLRRLYWINKIAGSMIILLVLAAFTVWFVKAYV